MAETLFDYMFNAWNAPVKAEEQRVELNLHRTQLAAAQLELRNHAQDAQVMQKIWGIGGADAAADAAGNPTEADINRWQMTARYYGARGNVAAAEKATQTMGTLMYRSQQQANQSAAADLKQVGQAGAQAGAFLESGDQDTYTNEFTDFRTNLPKRFQGIQLTGNLEQDKQKLQYIATSAQTYNQQQAQADREQGQADKQTNFGIMAGLARDRIKQGQERIDKQQKAQDNLQTYREHAMKHEDNQDAMAKEKLDIAKLKSDGHVTIKPVNAGEAKFATGVLAEDPRTSWMPQDAQATYGYMAAQLAKKYYPDLSLPEGVSHALDDMHQEGLLDPASRGGLFGTPTPKSPAGFKAPAGAGKAPAAPTAPATTPHAGLPQDYSTAQQLYEAVKKDPTLKKAALEYAKKKGW